MDVGNTVTLGDIFFKRTDLMVIRKQKFIGIVLVIILSGILMGCTATRKNIEQNTASQINNENNSPKIEVKDEVLPLSENELLKGEINLMMTPDDVIKKYGPPLKKHVQDDDVSVITELTYDGLYLAFEKLPGDQRDYLFNITINSPNIVSVRGIKVGDSLEKVIKLFPNKGVMINDRTKLLYGQLDGDGYIDCDKDNGSAEYENGKIRSLTYGKGIGFGAYYLTMRFENDKITEIEIEIGNI